jgi:multidrug resistance efflux pump
MAKQFKTTTLLADDSGTVWVEAQLSEAQVKRIIKGYERAGVSLTAYGSPNQVKAQVEEINAFFANDERSRSFVEAGKLQVVGVGF